MKELPFKSELSSIGSHQSSEVSSGCNQSETVNYRDQFKAFLRKERFSDYGAERFLETLSLVDFYISSVVTPNHRTVFEIDDVDVLTKYHSALMEDFAFVTKDRSKGRRLGRALLEYIEFAKMLSELNQPKIEETVVGRIPKSSMSAPAPDEILPKAQLVQRKRKHELIRQAQLILQPIEEYFIEYHLSSYITFEYHSTFHDVDVIAPRFKKDVNTEAEELGQLVSLMRKYEVAVPPAILKRNAMANEMKELRDNVRSFENWIVGYMAYLPLNHLEVNSIYYSPDTGFKINLSGKDVDPITIKIKTSIANPDLSTDIIKRRK